MLSYLKLGVTRGCFRFENGSAGFEALPADCNEACNRVDQSYANQVGHIVLLKSGTFALSATRSTCETSEFFAPRSLKFTQVQRRTIKLSAI